MGDFFMILINIFADLNVQLYISATSINNSNSFHDSICEWKTSFFPFYL